MKQLFDNLSLQVSELTTRTYSTSFTLGIYFLDKKFKDSIYSIYGFVRVADEIVDSFHDYDQERLLNKFKNDTYQSIVDGVSTNPILNSFQKVVNDFQIEHDLINAFIESMKMDLYQQKYTPEQYQQYIFGSAEVVGLMCLKVFTSGNKKLYENLKHSAKKLGSAFQKVNFLRDINQDYHLLGRTYFPHVNLKEFSLQSKRQIEREIEEDFEIALEGIKKLPVTCKGGVYLAYVYYRSLFNKIKKTPPHLVFSKRIRIHNGRKFGLMLSSMMQHKMNLL